PYADAAHTGTAHLDAEAVAAHVVACTEAGLQAGFHAIGDAAIGAVTEGVRAAADKLGLARIRAARHRVEHAEMLTPDTVAAFAELGLTASVQPAFDALWGGEDGMYARRLGAERARTLNPFAALLRSEEHTSELQSRENLVCRLLLEKKKKKIRTIGRT